jgi:hypothetical protein
MKTTIAIAIFLTITGMSALGQEKTITYKTKFEPESVTYNGSPNPNECWEAVDHGIRIKTSEGEPFFTMPSQDVQRLKERIKDAEVVVEVFYYPVLERAQNGSGASGSVVKVTQGNEVLFPIR